MSPRRMLGVALVALLPFVAACGAGKNAETQSERATPYIANAKIGALTVTTVALVPSTDTTGYLVATVVNSGRQADTLTGVTLDNGGTVQPGGSGGGTVQPATSIRFVDPDLGESGPSLRVGDLREPLRVGTSARVTFQFQNAGSVSLDVPVKASDSYGTTATSTPVPLTGSYPTLSAQNESGSGAEASASETP